MTRRSALVVSLAASLAFVAPAKSDDPVPTRVLPNLRQELPSEVKVAQVSGQWRLGFGTEVTNAGPGYLKITGNGPGDAPMTADQVVQMSDGSESTIAGIGEMHYVIGGGHEHWHLLDFERYELRRANDPGTPLLKDQKTGFCLANAFTADICGRNHPELTTVSEGIAAGGSDVYLGYLEGQYITLDRDTVPTGDYLLVNRVNPTGALLDADDSDDVATVRLSIKWGLSAPAIKITNNCPGSIECPGPITEADPEPTPDPQPITPTPEPVVPLPNPEPVPIVPPSQFAPATSKASLSRSMAGRLVRRAIQKSLNAAPSSLRTNCDRRSADTFQCKSTWRGWTGRVRVWYEVRSRNLAWFFTLTARRNADGKRVEKRAVQGSVSRAVFDGPAGALYCAPVPGTA